MQLQTKKRSALRRWLRPTRLIPLATSMAAGAAGLLALLGVVAFSPAEAMILALLGLLAIDSLTERIGVLERIENLLGGGLDRSRLRSRAELARPNQFAAQASTIEVLALSGLNIVSAYCTFYKEKLRSGCNIRFLLLDPQDEILRVLELRKGESIGPHIEDSIQKLRSLIVESAGLKSTLEVKLSPVFLPFSMFPPILYVWCRFGVGLRKDDRRASLLPDAL